jgi:methylated-DNA-[protein]-cysteine S-methyltransferase
MKKMDETPASIAEIWSGQAGARVTVSGGAVVHIDLLPLGGKKSRVGAPKDKTLAKALKEVKEFLDGKRQKFSVPVRQDGSPFHLKVWKALSKVPYGRVVTYGELAHLAGAPGAARAVGTAMNRNRLPLVVPCHRVVASNGIGGFGCGIEWKKMLLDLEKDQ